MSTLIRRFCKRLVVKKKLVSSTTDIIFICTTAARNLKEQINFFFYSIDLTKAFNEERRERMFIVKDRQSCKLIGSFKPFCTNTKATVYFLVHNMIKSGVKQFVFLHSNSL